MSSSALAGIEERRLHPVGMLLSAISTVRRWAGVAAFPGIAALVNGEFGMRTLLLVLLAFVVLAALSAVWGVLSWRATTYRISGGAFHLKRGVLQKSERSLPLEHVQSVNTVQGIVQRVFGVVELRLEAAGGAGEPEVSLSALSRPDARELREELTRARRTLDETGEAVEEPSPTVLRKLSTGALLVAGLTSGQLGVAISVVAGGSQIVDDLLPGNLAERLSEALLPRTIFAALLLVLFVALFAWVLAIFGTVLAHAGFTLSRSADGKYLHIKRGLLNRYETTVPLARIQAVRLVEGALRQPFGLAALRVESAGFGTEEGVSTVLFPLLRRSEAEDFLRSAAPSSRPRSPPSSRCPPAPGGATPSGRRCPRWSWRPPSRSFCTPGPPRPPARAPGRPLRARPPPRRGLRAQRGPRDPAHPAPRAHHGRRPARAPAIPGLLRLPVAEAPGSRDARDRSRLRPGRNRLPAHGPRGGRRPRRRRRPLRARRTARGGPGTDRLGVLFQGGLRVGARNLRSGGEGSAYAPTFSGRCTDKLSVRDTGVRVRRGDRRGRRRRERVRRLDLAPLAPLGRRVVGRGGAGHRGG
ncbi:PH domain-containing protein [Rubrobacter marinus]|uniref:PH domain-containing protein n=1 Tax=Rubrobacter marinus TaxID=2653852 RepID=A0A6G8Q1H8_9ACTN|nr:PH domain-containing protein [Rubrobacter marinus]QIN80270.1 PH domain-containing protein [Rubrobacter marinus]